MLLMTSKRACCNNNAILASIAAVALLWSAGGVQQDTWNVDDPSSWVQVLDNWLPRAPDDCKETVNQARDGLKFAISTGGIKWCRYWGCTRGVGFAGYDDSGWTNPLFAPQATEIRINKRFQAPSFTGLVEASHHPDVTFGVVLGHESVHAFNLKNEIEEAAHLAFSNSVNHCFEGVEHPKLAGNR